MKRASLSTLWCVLIAESVYAIAAVPLLHVKPGHMVQPVAIALLAVLLATTQARVRWVVTLLRALIGLEFVLSVADRFGLLGAPGSGVAWGDFTHFIAYTREVNAFFPENFAPILAVLATICETAAGLALILGIGVKYSAKAAAILLCVFGCAMIASGLIESQFYYAVLLLAAILWAVSEAETSWLSVDRIISRLKTRQAHTPPSKQSD